MDRNQFHFAPVSIHAQSAVPHDRRHATLRYTTRRGAARQCVAVCGNVHVHVHLILSARGHAHCYAHCLRHDERQPGRPRRAQPKPLPRPSAMKQQRAATAARNALRSVRAARRLFPVPRLFHQPQPPCRPRYAVPEDPRRPSVPTGFSSRRSPWSQREASQPASQPDWPDRAFQFRTAASPCWPYVSFVLRGCGVTFSYAI